MLPILSILYEGCEEENQYKMQRKMLCSNMLKFLHLWRDVISFMAIFVVFWTRKRDVKQKKGVGGKQSERKKLCVHDRLDSIVALSNMYVFKKPCQHGIVGFSIKIDRKSVV